MRGHNETWISGAVGGRIISGFTRDEEPAMSFAVIIYNGKRNTTVRVNAYGDLALLCTDRLERGSYCSVVGELMNREGQYGELTEIRAKTIVFFDEKKEQGGDRE